MPSLQVPEGAKDIQAFDDAQSPTPMRTTGGIDRGAKHSADRSPASTTSTCRTKQWGRTWPAHITHINGSKP